MDKVVLDDLMGLPAYEKVRDRFRQEIIEYKKHRRVAIGDRVSLVFENKKTVVFQILEMMRAERITDLDKIREEIAIYNSLIPDAGELSATLFIEIEDQSRIRDDLLRFLGIDEAVYLKIGDRYTIRAKFEPGRSKEDKLSAVQYVRFQLDADQQAAFLSGKHRITIRIDHPNYQAEGEIGEETRKSLAEDLRQ
ncbi:MAG TPA: DUF3501 family protein [Candidatus Acidoferrales bacterium]|nr:DUF3501 family protein [Candidatus Acidoferrales bacterium]